MATKAAAKAPATEELVAPFQPFVPGMESWAELRAGADQVQGSELAKDELLDTLVGVPFLIYRVVTRPGIVRRIKTGESKQFDYVSCELVLCDEAEMKRRRVDLSMLPFAPGDQVVFNDGSTGIWRQIVAYLHARGFITLPDGPTEGPSGESIYDLPVADWSGINIGKLNVGDDGHASYTADVRLFCPRGLRVSEYSNEFNPDGSKTRYLG